MICFEIKIPTIERLLVFFIELYEGRLSKGRLGLIENKKGLHKANPDYSCAEGTGDPYGNRTRVTAVKGRCLSRLTNGP